MQINNYLRLNLKIELNGNMLDIIFQNATMALKNCSNFPEYDI